MNKKSNTVAVLLQSYAIINFLMGMIFVYVSKNRFGDFTFLVAGAILVVSGFIYALGEIVQLLQEVKDNTTQTTNKAPSAPQSTRSSANEGDIRK